MAIELDNIGSGFSRGKINLNFEKIEEALNQLVLKRQGLETGEANQMEVPLDMNGYPIINVGFDSSIGGSPLTVDAGNALYINVSGDSMEGPLVVLEPTAPTHPAQKQQLDTEIAARQAADSNIQAQLTGNTPLEASAFSEISWHGQEIKSSVTIPANKNAWSFGPSMAIEEGQSVTIGEGSYWTIANGLQAPTPNYDEGTL